MKIVFAIAACLAACLICLDAHRSGERFGGHGPRNHTGDDNETRHGNETHPGFGFGKKPHRGFRFDRINGTKGNFSRISGDKYSWNRTLDENTTASEGAFIQNGSQVVVIRSRGRSLRSRNVTQSTSIYDFSNATSIVLYAVERFFTPCFLAKTDLTFAQVKDELAARNGSKVENANNVSVNASATPLSPDEANALRDSNPSVRFACAFKLIYRVAVPEPNTPLATNATEQVVIYNLDSAITITYFKVSPIRGPFGPLGNGGPGGPRPKGPDGLGGPHPKGPGGRGGHRH